MKKLVIIALSATLVFSASAALVGEAGESGVIKEQRDEGGQQQDRSLEKEKTCDTNELAGKTHDEAEDRDGTGDEAVGDCAVNCRHGTFEELVGESVEGLGQLADHHTYSCEEDDHVNGEVDACLEDVHHIPCGSREAGVKGHHGLLADDGKNDTHEDEHEHGCGYDVVSEH